jgi:cell division protein FtsI/penicillin-binding protein 2
LACVTVFFGLAVYSQARLQVTNRGEVMKKAEDTWMLARQEAAPIERGTIYSSDMRVLAQSRPKYEFWLFYDRVPCTPGFFMALAEASGIPEARISAPFKEGKKRTWLDPLDETRYQAVRRVMAEWGADGVSLEESNAREYPLGEAAVGVVGWMQEGKPRSGIELSFDKALSGQAQAEALSASLGGDTISGADIVLTIDSSLQAVAAKAVEEAVEKNKARSGAIVVLSPATGDVLAMSHWPAFDPSSGPNGVSELATGYMEDLQPGSTFKVLTLAKALDAGVVDETFTFDCKGSMDLGRNRLVRCDDHGPSRAHGLIDLDKAIAKSCNVCAATWALKIGRDPMLSYLRDLGLLSKPDIGLPGAVTPIFDMNEWDKERQLAVLGFGQSIAVPPINLAAAIATIANDGEYVAPRLVSQVGGKRNVPATPKRVFSPQAAQSVRRYMESVVHTDYGTAKTLTLDTRAAGKTGTAQKLGPDGGYVSSFVAMLPADKPQVLVLVVINDPRAGVIYGSTVAGPPYLEVARAAVSKFVSRPSHS